MSTIKSNIQKIKSINPRLSDRECLIIHHFMDHMSVAMGRINLNRFSLSTLKGVMTEFFPDYSCGTSVIMDARLPYEQKEALLVSIDHIEFNIFLDSELKIIVFREENPYHHIFEISANI